jgi:hypothetical protein
MKVSSSRALELGEQFLGKGYKELVSGSGRYVSADGTRVFRMGVSDITGAHGGGPHVNFETLIPNPAKAGKLTPNAKGILPSGDLGNIINVGGMDVRLIGGRVENGQVILSSFSRKGL